jgi:protocatechuate 3,4-dioxygenase beta subunit
MSRATTLFVVLALAVAGGVTWLATSLLRNDLQTLSTPSTTPESAKAPEPLPPPRGVETPVAPERTVEHPALPTPKTPSTADPNAPAGIVWGRVLGPTDAPVAYAQVELLRGPTLGLQVRSLAESTGLRQSTDVNGSYRFPAVEPNEDYILAASHEEFGTCEVGPVVVVSGEEVQAPDIKLVVGLHVEGTVTTNGRPVVDGDVTLSNSMDRLRLFQPQHAQEREKDPNFQPFEMKTRTDGRGRYQFDAVPIDTFEITAEQTGLARVTKSSQATLLGSKPRDHTIDFELGAAARISGRVVGESKNGIEGATVNAAIAGQNFRCEAEATTGPDGRFTLESLAPGRYFLRVTRAGFSDANRNQVEAGTSDLEILLNVQGGVSGIVVDEQTGSPIPEFKLDVIQEARGRGAIDVKENVAFQDAGGRFELLGLDPGDYSLVGRAAGYADTPSEAFEVARGQTTPAVRIALNRGGSITGLVVDNAGAPIKGALVLLRENGTRDNPLSALDRLGGSSAEKRARTGADGAFRIDLVVPGKWQIAIRHQRFAQRDVDDVEVVKGETKSIGSLQLVPGGRVSGHVYDVDGKPLGGAGVVAVVQASGVYKRALSNNDGGYEFNCLPDGEYIFTIQDYPSDPPISPLTKLVYSKNSRQTHIVNDGDDLTVDLRLKK